MASGRGRAPRQSGRGRQSNDGGASGGEGGAVGGVTPGTTGRYLVLLRETDPRAGVELLRSGAGLEAATASDFDASAVPAGVLSDADAIIFDTLGVAVVSAVPEQAARLSAAAADDGAILAIEEERIVYALLEREEEVLAMPAPLPLPIAEAAPEAASLPIYLRGYQDAVNHLVERLLGAMGAEAIPGVAAPPDESVVTWGLQATNVLQSRFTGRGIRVAVLDTGFDLTHPDFVGRRVIAQSFIPNEAAQDGHGHGTHCIGTACGPARPGRLPRYGVAGESEIFVGKVLSNQGSGSDGGILAGIEWAIRNRCPVVSMSLGAPVGVGQTFSRVFETAARRALSAGTLIIAAAGNDSRRPGVIAPVSHPANCPSIMAVAALDSGLAIASFSSGGRNLQGGQVDIAGPGVAVTSSWPQPTLYRTISGTSMATPHVAGIAALYAEANPDVRGGALGWLLLQSAQRLTLPTRDVGAGLVQAP